MMTSEDLVDTLGEEEMILTRFADLKIAKHFDLNSEQFLDLEFSRKETYFRIARRLMMNESSKLDELSDQLEDGLE